MYVPPVSMNEIFGELERPAGARSTKGAVCGEETNSYSDKNKHTRHTTHQHTHTETHRHKHTLAA